MRGDSIVIEDHHRKAARGIAPIVLQALQGNQRRIGVSIAGESGSGKSETAAALAEVLAEHAVVSVIFQQDDYFKLPPKSNDRARRADIAWVGPQEVKLALMDEHLRLFLGGATAIEKPLVIYEEDRVTTEIMEIGRARVAIAEGTYTTLLESVSHRAFIDRDYTQTRKHREKRNRNASELDAFIDRVLEIEHSIISSHKAKADIIIDADYCASLVC